MSDAVRETRRIEALGLHFSVDDLVFSRATEQFTIEADRIAHVLPTADIQHVGGTAIRGCRTKGDLDIQVRVPSGHLAAASAKLMALYDRDEANPPDNGRVSFRAPGDPAVGVQLTAIGSPEDKFWRFREVLLARLDLRSAYDRLKADHEGRSSAEYRNAKAAFFVTLMSTPEYRALDQHMAEADILSAVTPSVSNAGAEQGPVFVVMSGPPGSGKSTIAPTLAAQLGIPLFSKDTIKESLMDALGVDDAAASRRLGAAAIRVMLALARENGRGLLDNNWAASLAIDDLHALGAPIVEVFCRCPPEVSRGRHAARRRHPGHFDEMRAADDDLWFGRASRPLAGGWPVIEIDTVTPVNVPALAQQVKTLAQLA